MVSPIEPDHSPFKNTDTLACPGGRHWDFGDKISARVPIAGLKEICRSDQIAAFVKRGANRQNARGTRRKIGAVSRNGRDSLGQLFRCDRGCARKQHAAFTPYGWSCLAARSVSASARREP